MKTASLVFVLICIRYAGEALDINLNDTRTPPEPGVCGADFLYNETINEGLAAIETYPWLGILIYNPTRKLRSTTSLILISKEIALTAALDIDHYPKGDFREKARVIFGHNCSGPFIRVKEYVFHPEFSRSTFSAPALLQLDTTRLKMRVYPICSPPTDFNREDEVFAMSLTPDCINSTMVEVYRMEYVDTTQCYEFYRRAELDMETMWPTHLACARGLQGGHCIWRSGTALVIRDRGVWRLLGIGTYGPGCESPSRFLDYGMYKRWVKRSVDRIGHPSITRIAPNHLILRRMSTNVQRFGPCDPEETKYEIFTDRTIISPPYALDLQQVGHVKYNLSLVEHVEYQCIVFRVRNRHNVSGIPRIKLRRWCTNPTPICPEFTMLTLFFYVEITFEDDCIYSVQAYGREIRYVDAKKLLRYTNNKKEQVYIYGTSFHWS